MSSGGGGGDRVSIPSSARKMIQDIKEIAVNHSDDDIYALLKECSMDPNETAQKLLFQDTFHEVKRKRDRRKENLTKESPESRWKPGTQVWGNRAGRGKYSSRYITHDARGGKNSALGKETGNNHVSEKGPGPSSLPISQETKNKETTPVASSSIAIANGPTHIASGSTSVEPAEHLSAGNGDNQSETTAAADIGKLEGPPPLLLPADANKNPAIAFGTGEEHRQIMPNSNEYSASMTTAIYFSASDPVLLPSQDSRLSSVVGTIRRELGSKQTPAEQISVTSAESKSTSAPSKVGSSFMQGKMPSKHQGAGKNNLSDSLQPPSSTRGSSSVSRPSSNYNNRTQVIGPQKVVYSKEWKPKPINPGLSQGTVTALSSEVSSVSVEADFQSEPPLSVLDSKEATPELQSKLEEAHISDGKHVIIPNHLHVPDAEKLGFCFGSFDASFRLNTSNESRPESDKSPPPLSETSEEIEETVEQSSRHQNALATAEGNYSNHLQSTLLEPEKSGEVDVSSSVVPEYSESKQERALTPEGHQYSAVHTSSSHGIGFMPPMLGSQLAPFESSESQARDLSHLPGFVVQQPFDPASYYAQFYRSSADTDGRVSPFRSAGVAMKYNGNVAVVSPQASQSPQEGGNSFMLSAAGPSPLVTQTAGVMQNSIAHQPLPVFRQPNGLHLPHYPPNYIPYGHYFPPYFVPPPAIHQFLSNGAFPQQPQAGSVYPPPPLATAKYSLSQYKPGANTGNSIHTGVPSSYGPYSSSVAAYNPNSAAPAGNSTSNEDLSTSQFKESNAYVTSPQSEGSGAWIAAAPGRDISGLQASSLYNLPHGQLAFTPTQAGHGTFPGIYHPSQTMTAATVHPLMQQSQAMVGSVDMAGPPGSIYQQPQPAQINWPNSY